MNCHSNTEALAHTRTKTCTGRGRGDIEKGEVGSAARVCVMSRQKGRAPRSGHRGGNAARVGASQRESLGDYNHCANARTWLTGWQRKPQRDTRVHPLPHTGTRPPPSAFYALRQQAQEEQRRGATFMSGGSYLLYVAFLVFYPAPRTSIVCADERRERRGRDGDQQWPCRLAGGRA